MVDNLGGAARERVGRRLSEDVAHVGAGRDHELTATHPDLWGNLRTERSPLQLTRITRQVVLWPRSGPAMANQLKNKPAIQSAQFLTKEHTLSIDLKIPSMTVQDWLFEELALQSFFPF